MGDLLKQLDLRGLSWRALLLCGILPALLLFGVADYLYSLLGAFLTDIAKPQDYWSKHSAEIIALLVISSLFAALRTPIFAFYRRLPIPMLRGWFLVWHAALRGSAEFNKQKALWRITVARWYERDFTLNVFVAESVRKSIRLPAEAGVQASCIRSRAQIVSNKLFPEWRVHSLNRTLNWLFCMAAMRTAVAKRAAEIAASEAGHADADNWTAAETELGFHAPGDWVPAELEEWKRLYTTNLRAKNRIEALNRYQLNDKYAKAYQKAENYPAAEWIEATALGNSMAALEDYANLRYGVDTSLLWSRIEKVIPKAQREEVAASQIAVQALLNCSTALGLASAAVLVLPRSHVRPVTAPTISPATLFLLFFVTASLAWIFHRFAAYAARQFRFQIESRIDLYIPRWLAALGLIPKDIEERKRMIAAVGAFADGSAICMPNFVLQAITDPVLVFDKPK